MSDERTEFRTRYFAMYQTIKFKECFYSVHRRMSTKYKSIFSAVTILVSISSALAWSVSNSLPILWALLIAVAQLAQTLSGITPWADRLDALKYLLPETRALLLSVENTWNEIDLFPADYTSERINQKRAEYDRAFHDLEAKYIGTLHFPQKQSIINSAQEESELFFKNRYFIENEEGRNEVAG